MKNKAFIYIPVWKNIALVKLCLKAIKQNTVYQNYSVTLIDDGNEKADSKKIKMLGRTICHKKNKGFTYSINTAREDFLQYSNSNDYFILLNSDTLPQKYWLSELTKAAKKYKDTGIFSAVLLETNNPDIIVANSTNFPLTKNKKIQPLNNLVITEKTQKINKTSPWAEFAAVLITYNCLKKCGPFDPQFINYGSDVDYCFRANYKNFKTRYITQSKVLHKRHASLLKLPAQKRLTLFTDLKKLKNKLLSVLKY